MALIHSLLISLGVKSDQFEKGMSRSRTSMRGLQQQTASATTTMMRFGQMLLTGYVARGLARMVTGTMQAMDSISKLSDRLGTSTELLSGLDYAAQIMGASFTDVSKGLQYFLKGLAEAEQNIGEFKYVLDALNLSLADFKKLDTQEQLLLMADQMEKLESASMRAFVAQKAFGRGGKELTNLLMLGRGGVEALLKEAEKLGYTFDRLTGKQIEEANDAMTRMKAALTGLKRAFAIELAPSIETAANKLTEMILRIEDARATLRGFYTDMLLGAQAMRVVEASGRDAGTFIKAINDGLWSIGSVMAEIPYGVASWLGVEEWERIANDYRKLGEEMGKRSLEGFKSAFTGEEVRKQIELYNEIAQQAQQKADQLRLQNRLREAGSFAYWSDAPRQIEQVGEETAELSKELQGAEKAMARMNQRIDEEILITGKLNETHERAKQILEFQQAAFLRYGEGAEEATRAIEQFRSKLDELGEVQKLARAAEMLADAWGDAFERMIYEGAKWQDVMRSMIAGITREIAKIYVIEPMARAIMGPIGTFMGMAMGMPTGGTAAATTTAAVPHGGGVIGFDAIPTRQVPTATFAGAPRLHDGLKSDEFPAILQRGETVTAKDESTGNVVVNINLQSWDSADTQRWMMRNQGALATTIQKAIQNNHPLRHR